MATAVLSESEYRKVASKALVRSTTMDVESTGDVVDTCTMCVDKHMAAQNWEAAAKTIKETLDKKLGPTWQVACGQGFAFDVTHSAPNMVYVYYIDVAVLAFKQ